MAVKVWNRASGRAAVRLTDARKSLIERYMIDAAEAQARAQAAAEEAERAASLEARRAAEAEERRVVEEAMARRPGWRSKQRSSALQRKRHAVWPRKPGWRPKSRPGG